MDQKILITFISSSIHDMEIQIAIQKFESNGFTVVTFDLKEDPISILDLPNILNSLRNTLELNKRVRMSLLSDFPHYIFSWYRCYNALIDDFIYIMPKNTTPVLPPMESTHFFINLRNMVGIEQETVQGKIYINLNPANFFGITQFLLSNNLFRYFQPFDEFQYNFTEKKQMIKKIYGIGETRIESDLQAYSKTESIELGNGQADWAISVPDILRDIPNHKYFAPYLLFGIYKELSNNGNLELPAKIMTVLKSHYASYPKLDQTKIGVCVLRILSLYRFPFFQTMQLLMLISTLNLRENKLLQVMMEKLIQDNQHVLFHHTILTNSLYLISMNNIKTYPTYDLDKRLVFARICQLYKQEARISDKTDLTNRNPCIVMMTNQLLNLEHSPTYVTLLYAKYISSLYPDYEIVIIVEDNLRPIEPELHLPRYFTHVSSTAGEKKHQAFLSGTANIKIIYAAPENSKSESIYRILDQVFHLNPSLIFTTSELSVPVELLFPYYPVVYLSYGTIVPTGSADIYLFKDQSEAVQANSKLGTISADRIVQFTGAVKLSDPSRSVPKSEYGLLDSDFVLVTVGNRLNAEITTEFSQTVISFLNEHADAKWLVIGPGEIDSIDCDHQELIGKQIIRIQYEPELQSLFTICDVFVNPVRHGGGKSVVMAMKAGLPIVISSIPSDGLVYVGIENSIEGNVSNYRQELEKLYHDLDYRRSMGELMQERLDSFTEEKLFAELKSYFSFAKESFQQRCDSNP